MQTRPKYDDINDEIYICSPNMKVGSFLTSWFNRNKGDMKTGDDKTQYMLKQLKKWEA